LEYNLFFTIRFLELNLPVEMKAIQALEQGAQGSGGVTIPGGVQKTCRYGTSRHCLADMVVLQAWWCWVDGWT